MYVALLRARTPSLFYLSHRVSDVVHDPRAALVDGEVRELEALGRQFDAVVRFLAPSPPSSPGTDRYGDDDHGNDDGDRRGERGLRGRRGPGAATPSGSGGPLRGRRRNPVVKQRRVYLRDLDGCESRGDAVRRRRGREGCLGIFRGEGQQRAEDRVGVSCRVGGDGVSHDHAGREAAPRIGTFAAGDIVRGASLVVWGVRDGRDAAASIDSYIMAQSEAPRAAAGA